MSTDAFYLRRTLEGDAIDPRRNPVWSAAFWAELLRLAGDRTARAITGYGVRPWRMVWWLVMPLLLATLFFVALPGMTVAPPSLNPTPGRARLTRSGAAHGVSRVRVLDRRFAGDVVGCRQRGAPHRMVLDPAGVVDVHRRAAPAARLPLVARLR